MSKEQVNILAEAEQLETLLISMATILASYYKKLIEEGVPPILAEGLTMDWHRIWWTRETSKTDD